MDTRSALFRTFTWAAQVEGQNCREKAGNHFLIVLEVDHDTLYYCSKWSAKFFFHFYRQIIFECSSVQIFQEMAYIPIQTLDTVTTCNGLIEASKK